jgi:hypothetical protein
MRQDWIRFSILAVVLGLQLTTAGLGQTSSMLTGSAVGTTTALSTKPLSSHLIRQQARYDSRPITRVRTHTRTVYLIDRRTYWQRHPMVKGAAIGAGVGAGAGAVTGLVTHRGVLRGAAIGAGTGAGVGVIRTSKVMKRHPIVKDVATGAATGLGLGWAGGHHHGTIAKATGVGAAVGLGVGLFKHLR